MSYHMIAYEISWVIYGGKGVPSKYLAVNWACRPLLFLSCRWWACSLVQSLTMQRLVQTNWTEHPAVCHSYVPNSGFGPWSIMGFPDYHEMIITFLNITGSSTKQNILDQFFLDVLGFHSLVAAFPRRSSMVMKQHARVLTREKPMWNSWAGRTAGWVFHGISWYFSCKVTSPLWIRREKSKILYKWRICMFLAGKIPEGNGGILEGSYGNHHVYTYNNK